MGSSPFMTRLSYAESIVSSFMPLLLLKSSLISLKKVASMSRRCLMLAVEVEFPVLLLHSHQALRPPKFIPAQPHISSILLTIMSDSNVKISVFFLVTTLKFKRERKMYYSTSLSKNTFVAGLIWNIFFC